MSENRYSLNQIDSMRHMIAQMCGPHINVEERLRTYILAGVTHDEVWSAYSKSEAARQNERENAAAAIKRPPEYEYRA